MGSITFSRRQTLAGIGSFSVAAAGAGRAGAAPAGKRPNVVFIIADEMGYGDLSVYGQTDYITPHIDQLAARGVRLTQAYANSAVCSASRFAIITGRYQYRLRGGLEEPIAGASDTLGLPPDHPTLPSLFRKAGYRTALFGKWHLGSLPKFGPTKSGYDVFFGNFGGAVDYFTHKGKVGEKEPEDLYEGTVPVHKTGYYTHLLGDRAVDYIEKAAPDVPFFLSLHFTAPHWPWEGPGDEAVSRDLKDIFHYDGGSLATYAKIVAALDEQAGRVTAALAATGQADNTVIVFTSDNGGERFSKTWPFSGQKTELLEGGIRVPALVVWPGRISPGSVCTQVAAGMDWLPTLLATIDAAPDPAYPSDGMNLLPALLGQAAPHDRTLFWRYKANRQRAVRSGDWKYLKINDNEFLFNVVVDTRERANLAERNPDMLKHLKSVWDTWNKGMLPIRGDSYSHKVTPQHQADHYRAEQTPD
ncbi:sulfatase-like hydrolase/transferase [Novosphingobium sp.]|uniref:sulfatase family protein n=1 Tax=Novosphingobium sp. TaxID=1874826 RepID=UPI003341C6E7